jgi:hypothetical protein
MVPLGIFTVHNWNPRWRISVNGKESPDELPLMPQSKMDNEQAEKATVLIRDDRDDPNVPVERMFELERRLAEALF